MPRTLLLLPIAMCCAAFALPANALVAFDRPAAKLEKPLVTVATHCKAGDHCAAAAHCPPGTRWTPAKYGRAGKWRVAHCTTWKAQPADSAANQLNAQEAARNAGGGMGAPGGMGGAPPAPVYGGPRTAPYGQPNQLYGIPGSGQPSPSGPSR